MSTRAYDYIVRVSNATAFRPGNSVIGVSTGTVGEIISKSSNNLRIKLSNVYQTFSVGETLRSNTITLTSYNVLSNVTTQINGTTNTFNIPRASVPDDAINVYVNGEYLSKEYYVRASSTQIRFANRTRLNSTTGDIETYVFPDTSVKSLVIQTVSSNTEARSFIASNYASQITTATSTIAAVTESPYIAEKNSTVQTPLVKLFTIYYPGEWYPENSNGNPSLSGSGFPWPYGFPMRFAQILGESYSDFNYSVSFNNVAYKVIGIDSGDISVDSSGKIGEMSMSISNFDGVIASIVENKNILGYNSSNNYTALVNGEIVQNIDPRTIQGNAYYDSAVALSRGQNAAWTYETTKSFNDTWTRLKEDTRDLLGAVVEVKFTYAKFLDNWPEYSIVRSSSSNSATTYSSLPYRVGDTVTSNTTSNRSTVSTISGNTVYFNNTNLSSLPAGAKLLIVNPDADPTSFVEYVFTINRLDELDEFVAKFSLTNWLQYYKMKLPKRKFTNTTCPWVYKGAECKYPSSGTGTIVGSNPPISANGYFTYSNETAASASLDICSKTLTACSLRKNLVNFGGFPGIKND